MERINSWIKRGKFDPLVSCRATSNHKVKETVALELSYVNSNLQLLKEELEELNSSMDVYQNDRWVWEEQPVPLGFHFSHCYGIFLGARPPLPCPPFSVPWSHGMTLRGSLPNQTFPWPGTKKWWLKDRGGFRARMPGKFSSWECQRFPSVPARREKKSAFPGE